MRIESVIFTLLIALSSVTAQNIDDVVYTFDKNVPSYMSIKDIDSFPLIMKSRNNTSALKNILLLNDETTTVLVDTLTDVAGGFHESYIELYKGIKVEGTKCNIHYNKDGIPVMINGNFRTINGIDTIGRISLGEGFNQALRHVGIDEKEWRDDLSIQKTSSTGKINTTEEYKQPEKVIYVKDDEAHLTYKYRIDCYDTDIHSWVYVDAMTGKVVDTIRAVCNITSNVTTVYSGQQSIESQYHNNEYRLRDYTRGSGIETYNSSGNDYTSPTSTWTSMSSYDRAALDVHWGVETTYDYYYNTLGRNSYDNHGAELVSFVNINHSNAYWTGNYMAYGIYNTYPMVSLDITAHELTHAFTQSTSALIYQGESGAINEGMSDVFATCIERYAKPNSGDNIWLCGEDIPSFDYRDMSNPDCKYYHGSGWVNTSDVSQENDYGGVHTNSGVFNYWFYQIVKGTTSETYMVDSIGFDKAINICYLMNASYLPSNATYHDAAQCSILAAKHLGYVDVVKQIFNAWRNVGVEVYPYINGPTIVIDTTAYNLDYLPERWNVTWQLSPASSFVALQILPNDSLGRPLCMLTKDIRYPYDGYIQAILYRNNDSITTVSKKIYGHLAMGKAYYVVRKYPSNQVIDAALIPPGNIIKYIKVGDILNYSSPNFKGMRGEEDVWHPNSIPNCVSRVPYSDNFTILPQATGYVIYRLQNPENYNEEYVFMFIVQPASGSYSINISPADNGYQVNLMENENIVHYEGIPEEDDKSQKTTTEDTEWTLNVYQSTSTKPIICKTVKGNSTSINTNGWSQGLYVIRAIVNGNTLTEKIIINN